MGFGKSTIILNGFVMGSKGFSKEIGHSDLGALLKMVVPPNALGEVGNDDSPSAPTMCRWFSLVLGLGFPHRSSENPGAKLNQMPGKWSKT